MCKSGEDKLMTTIYRVPNFIFFCFTFTFYVPIQLIFLWRLRKNLRMKFESHKWNYLIQSVGMQFYLLVEIIPSGINLLRIVNKTTQFFTDQTIFAVQLTGAMIFVLTKHPEDCFACFNLMDGSKRNYSAYQYPVEKKMDTYSRMIREQSEGVPKNIQTRISIDNLIMKTAAVLPG